VRHLIATAAIVLVAAEPLPGTWASGPQIPVACSEVAVATAGNTMYVIGGYANGSVDQSSVLAFHPVIQNGRITGSWRTVAPLPRGLNHIAAVADANVYDPVTDRWSALPALPHALGPISAAVLGDGNHLVGGRDAHSVATHAVYDPGIKRYSVRAPLPVGRDHTGLVAYGGRLHAIGGEARGIAAAYTTNERHNPAGNVWSEYAPLPEGRHGTGAAVIERRIYVPGGAPVPGGSRQSNMLFAFKIDSYTISIHR
jgi:Kelch motif